MTTPGIDEVSSDSFRAAPRLEGGRLVLEFSGSGDMSAIALVSDLLKQVHASAQLENIVEVCCDFRQLTFMNSSCFKSFVVWIDTVKNAERRYQILFLTDANHHWQRRSLEALRRLASNIVTIDTRA
jgi:hypothetical protein